MFKLFYPKKFRNLLLGIIIWFVIEWIFFFVLVNAVLDFTVGNEKSIQILDEGIGNASIVVIFFTGLIFMVFNYINCLVHKSKDSNI